MRAHYSHRAILIAPVILSEIYLAPAKIVDYTIFCYATLMRG